MIFMIKSDLWAHKLSSKNTNLLSGYFSFVFSKSISKYSSKYSFFVPPPLKNRKSSTPFKDIVAVQVRFFDNPPLRSNIAGSPIFE